MCAIKDDLRPVLEKAHEADVLIIGSPVYFSYPSGMTRSFMERLIFPHFTYDYDEQGNRRYRDEHFPKDLQNVFDLGKHLVEEAK